MTCKHACSVHIAVVYDEKCRLFASVAFQSDDAPQNIFVYKVLVIVVIRFFFKMESTNVDHLLQNYKVSDVVQVKERLKNDIDKKKSDLKNLIGFVNFCFTVENN